MSQDQTDASARSLRTDVLIVALIVAYTALPTRLAWPGYTALLDAVHPDLDPVDFLANVLGYIPLGLAVARRRITRALLFAGGLSLCVEVTQLFSVGRDADVSDVTANFVGAVMGIVLARRWRILPERVGVRPLFAALAAVAAIVYVGLGGTFTFESGLRRLSFWLEARPWADTNPRGSTEAGAREGHWSFAAAESGTPGDVARASGVVGSAAFLNGKQWVDLGRPVALRLTGSMTVSAWVKPVAFPADDAAVVSTLTSHEAGYQLDLTIDEGPRTIGFKIASGPGRLTMRYGRTPLPLGEWHHIAGVYDAGARTLDVYLDGKLDNGCLSGTVAGSQVASGDPVFVGRRAGLRTYEFTGSVDEVDIQSRPLSASEIQAEVLKARRPSGTLQVVPPISDQCPYERGDRPGRVAGPLASLGMLIVFAFAGLWRGPRFDRWALGVCLAAGATSTLWLSSSDLKFAMLAGVYILAGGLVMVWAVRK